ncbi:hypothetical protein AAZX31_20G081900 [Glycine max]
MYFWAPNFIIAMVFLCPFLLCFYHYIPFIIQGLLNRRIGATSINSESSHSHTVFTCVVESRCKVMHSSLVAWR